MSTFVCDVCYETKPILNAVYLPCYHRFCRHCIETWCDQQPTCPMCRGTTIVEHVIPNCYTIQQTKVTCSTVLRAMLQRACEPPREILTWLLTYVQIVCNSMHKTRVAIPAVLICGDAKHEQQHRYIIARDLRWRICKQKLELLSMHVDTCSEVY